MAPVPIVRDSAGGLRSLVLAPNSLGGGYVPQYLVDRDAVVPGGIVGSEAGGSCAACGPCMENSGPAVMQFAGAGAGDFAPQISYTYVGEGAGTLKMVAPKRLSRHCIVAAVVAVVAATAVATCLAFPGLRTLPGFMGSRKYEGPVAVEHSPRPREPIVVAEAVRMRLRESRRGLLKVADEAATTTSSTAGVPLGPAALWHADSPTASPGAAQPKTP